MKNLLAFAAILLLWPSGPAEAAASNQKGVGPAATTAPEPLGTLPSADTGAPTAHLVVYRANEFVGSLTGHRITVNGRRLGGLYVKTYLAVDLPPGDYTICNFGDEGCLGPLTLEAGRSYYLRDHAAGNYTAQHSGGSWNTSFWLEQKPEDQAREEFKDYRRLKLHRKFSMP